MLKVRDRYNSHLFLFVEKFNDLNTMLNMLKKDLNSSVEKRCGKYIG